VIAVIAAALGGLLVGSFLNVVAHRLPRGESLVRPRSRCTECGTQLRAIDNVPVISWLALRGRCHHCGTSISARYPIVELVTGALYIAVVASQDDAVVASQDDALRIVLGLLLVTALVPITLIDLELRIIPNVITGPAALAAVIAIAALDIDFLPEALIAGAAGGGFFLVAAILYPRGMGMGDVKLAGMLGLYLGRAVAPAIFIALIAGVVVGAAVIARKGAKEGRKTAVPFGPFLALGGMIAFFAGADLVDAYLDTF
jgi:leader peptidase (prepilin peptidase)/N-methyltransferase